MTDILSIIEQLRATASKNEKEAILRDNKNNELLKEVLKLTYNPFLNYNIKKIPEYIPAAESWACLEDVGFILLDRLNKRKVTGHAAIAELKFGLEYLYERDAKVLELIIKKDLSAGISTSTINKVFGKNFIPEYPIMLCEGKKYLNRIKYPALAQVKEDGARFNALVKNGAVEFRTRQGRVIELYGNLEKEFIELAQEHDVVFDGELLAVDDNGKILPRKEGNGIVNKAIKGTISQKEAGQIRVRVWDCIRYSDFLGETNSKNNLDRFKLIWDLQRISSPKIQLVEYHIVNSKEEALEYFQEIYSRGLEGIILKNFDGIWEDKRSKDQIKLKNESTCELRMVDFLEGEGQYQDKCGSILCRSEDEKLEVYVKPRTYADAEELWANPESFKGKILEVKYNEVIQSKDKDKFSLFLPVYMQIRYDKSEADTIDRIK